MSKPSFPKLFVVCDFCEKSFELSSKQYQSHYNGQISFHCSKNCKKENSKRNALARIEVDYVSMSVADRQTLRFNNILRRVKELEEFRLANIAKIKHELNVVRRIARPSDESRTNEMIKLHLVGETLSQIGKKFGVTRERVRQLLAKRGYSSKTAPVRPKKPKMAHELKCHGCEKVFESDSGSHKYCSDECRYPNTVSSRAKFHKFVCSGCGCEFERSEYLINIANYGKNKKKSVSDNTYCTRECYLKTGDAFGHKKKKLIVG